MRFHKVGSGTKSVTYPEALDEALAVGWIDGVRKRVDAGSYVQRFTPRQPDSAWSAVNVRKAERLTHVVMHPPATRGKVSATAATIVRRVTLHPGG